MFYTEEQIQRLEKYRKTFETAVNSDFARNVGSIALKEIESIYDEAFGSHYSYNNGCSVCVLQYLKRVGKPFLEESRIYQKREEKKKQEATEYPPDVEMKDGTITFNFERALAEEKEFMENLEKQKREASKTNASTTPKTNNRKKKKSEENGTEQP